MPILRFPDCRNATEEGILAVGGDLHPESLLLAYQQGIFPWPISGVGLCWFCPDPRAILEFGDLHIPKSLEKIRRRAKYTYTVDTNFSGVIEACQRTPRPGQDGTWITPRLKKAFIRFHQMGFAHSVEVWESRKLIGGVYGVAVEGVFSAESMFYRKPNASKLALLHLIELLRQKGVEWIDIQILTPHMQRLGACEISREAFLKKLRAAQSRRSHLFE